MIGSSLKTENLKLSIRGAFITHRGGVYGHNEDACYIGGPRFGDAMIQAEPIELITNDAPVVAVADGIGGNLAGEMASKTLVESFSKVSFSGQNQLKDHLRELDLQFYEKGKDDSSFSGMGTTVAGLCFSEEEVFAFNVGDARLYRKQDDYLMQVTKDDSIAQVLVDAGELSMDETRGKNLHQLTQAIGGTLEKKEIEVHTYPLKISRQVSFLVCSDGLHDMVSLDEIEAIMNANNSAMSRVNGLFRAAMENGGEDNITIIWLDLSVVT